MSLSELGNKWSLYLLNKLVSLIKLIGNERNILFINTDIATVRGINW